MNCIFQVWKDVCVIFLLYVCVLMYGMRRDEKRTDCGVSLSYLAASFPNAFTQQTAAQLQQAAANSPAGKQTEGTLRFPIQKLIFIILCILHT